MTMRIHFALLGAIASIAAANAQTPTLVLTTENYDLFGAENAQTIILGATQDGQISVDCGFGPQIYDVMATQYGSQGVDGTAIVCTVSAEGKIAVSAIDDIHLNYVCASGCGLTSLAMSYPEDIEILDLEHNSLQALDLSDCTAAKALYLGDNAYDKKPLLIGPDKPELQILDIGIVDNLDPSFTLTDYPALLTFDAMSNPTLYACDPSQCPGLMKLSIDNTNVSELDLSHNPELLILNISDTGIDEIDLSRCPKLRELYCDHMSGTYNAGTKLKSLDVSHNPELIYLFAAGNDFESIDVSANPKLLDIYVRHNKLTSIDLSNNQQLLNVMISYNNFDFNTLPLRQDSWVGYEYMQNPLQVPRSYLAGQALDLSQQLVRPEGPETFGFLYSRDENDPSELIAIDPGKYTFSEGVLTVNEAIADSVCGIFYNEAFPDCYLSTSMFKVKSAVDYGSKDMAISYALALAEPETNIAMSVGLYGAAADAPKTFYVDFGDGDIKEFTSYGMQMPDEPNAAGVVSGNGAIKIYTDQDEMLTAFALADVSLKSIDLDGARTLRDLRLDNTKLNEIDLQWNRCLENLRLTGNQFADTLNLEGNNGGYNKNVLTHLVLSNNEMKAVKLSPIAVLQYLDMSHNCLQSVDFTDAESIAYLDLSYNDFDYLKINYLSSLKTANLSYNKLSALVLPETNVIETLDIRGNAFTYANIPPANGLDSDHYLYAPQQVIPIIKTGPTCDLTSQLVTIDGCDTSAKWIEEGGVALPADDYEQRGGVTIFHDGAIGKNVYCELVNAAYPAFTGENALRTTAMEVAGMPEYVIAQFDTPEGGQLASLSLASDKEGDAIYIDWGNGMLHQYPLSDSYTLFAAETIGGATAKVYSYDADNKLSVFSIEGVEMENPDFSGMNYLYALSVRGAGLSEINTGDMPRLTELSLGGNEFSEFDFASYPSLAYVDFAGNDFASLDLSGLSQIQTISFSRNGLTDVKFGGNTQLWHIGLDNNELESIDLSEVPQAYQIVLSGNKLSSIDLEELEDLHVVMIDDNYFDFSTLPLPRSQWVLYVYGNQARIDAECIDNKVDLSSQSMVEEMPTIYVWSRTEPYIDEEAGGIVVEALEEGIDYGIEDGVTTFLTSQSNVRCLLYNEVFPSTYLLTTPVSVTVDHLTDQISTERADVEYYDLQGRRVVNPATGLCIRKQGNTASKIIMR